MNEIWAFFETFKNTNDITIWHPLVWIISITIAFLLFYIIRGMGQNEYKKDTEQTKVFLSGNPELEKEQMHIKAKNIYWGFTESLKWLYSVLDRMHSGNVSDYVLWFVIVLGFLFVLIEVI